jgi:hypothetical protein
MERLYRRNKNKKMIPVGYVCPQCGDIYIQDPELPMCNIIESSDPLYQKVKYDDWGIPVD